jgi:hypothetical protein
MATQKQIAANRANAARSTGPTTPEGKKIAAQNSACHGMLAQTVVLEGESKSRFEELLTAYIALIQPRSAAETAIVETMTIARWKEMRIWGIEKAGFQLEMSRESSAAGANATRGYLTFKKLADSSRVLDLQHRYETGYERQFCRAYAFLLRIREKSETPMDDSLPQSGHDLLQFSCATPTWDDDPVENEAPPEVVQTEEVVQADEQEQEPIEAPKAEEPVPAQPVSPNGPNSQQRPPNKQTSSPAPTPSGAPRPREKL